MTARHVQSVKLHSLSLNLKKTSVAACISASAGLHDIFYLWRPYLPDPDDDMLLELAVGAGCQRIVTFNQRDFPGIEQFGLCAVSPQEFLREIGVIP